MQDISGNDSCEKLNFSLKSAISKFVETRIHPPTKELFYIWYVGVVNSPYISYISVLKKRRLYLDFYLDDSNVFNFRAIDLFQKE